MINQNPFIYMFIVCSAECKQSGWLGDHVYF